MTYVRLQYTGKKPSLHLTMARLKAEYIFDKDNEMTAPVEYEDAAYLLRTNMAIFKVVGGPFEAAGMSALKAQDTQREPEPVVVAGDPNEGSMHGKLTGDGVEGKGPMPPAEQAENRPAPEEPKGTTKKGKNK